MNANRTLNAVLNGLGTAALGYAVARFRGSESPRRTALVWGVAGTLLSYVVLGRVDLDAIEERAREQAEEATEAQAAALDGSGDEAVGPSRSVVGAAVEHVMGFDDEGLEPDADSEATA